MRAFAILIGLLATLAGSYGAYIVMREVGPEDRTGEFGYGDAALAPPGGGTLLQSKNFPLVVKALQRELGPDGRLDYLTVEITSANASGTRNGQNVNIQIDASGRSRSTESGPDDSLNASIPL